MTSQSLEPGTLASSLFSFPGAGPCRDLSIPFQWPYGCARAASTAAKGRTGLSIPRELHTLRDLHAGPAQSIPPHSHTRPWQPHPTAAFGGSQHPVEGTLPFPGVMRLRDRPTATQAGILKGEHDTGQAFLSTCLLAGKSGGEWREFATCVRNYLNLCVSPRWVSYSKCPNCCILYWDFYTELL